MYGLVLEGGGARGSYQIGACKAIKEMGIELGAVSGTSVGALNGAMIVQGDIDKAYEMWYNMSPEKVIGFNTEELEVIKSSGFNSRDFNLILRGLKRIVIEKGIDVSPLINMLSIVIDEDKIRKSSIDFGVVTVNVTQVKAIEIFKESMPEGKITDYLIASSTFPGFKLKEIDGRKFVDGGLYNALPLNMVAKKGYKDIIAIRTMAAGRKKRFDTSDLNVIYISPKENLGPILDFRTERARKNLSLGYYDAYRTFKGLKGNKYYIEPLNDESFFIQYLLNISDESIAKLSKLLELENLSGKRALFENIIPRVASLLRVSEEDSYEDIFVALLESIADTYSIERFKIYNFMELVFEVSKVYKPGRFIRKDNVIENIAKELYNSILAREP
jgi:NTE family protein